ncbi:MAG: hypothetical protein A2Z16_03865 [Chloroflexi bacterium RBG_16_54_18]|nr:MAG: hypothetical protein A2Z16_03865 [Chloroflexi bacterium RBG_16_54_18]
MSWYWILRFLHITGAALFIGGVFARQLVRSRLRKTSERDAFAELTGAARLIDERLVIPGSGLVLLAGIILAWMTGAPFLGFIQAAPQNWLLVSNILIILGMLLVVRVFLPVRKQIEAWVAQAGADETVPSEIQALINRPRLQLAYLLEEISLLVIVALMVFKPF